MIAGDVLHTGASGYSQLLSSYGAGAIAGALATAQRGAAAGRGGILLAALSVYGLATTCAVQSRSQGLSMALLFVSGWSLVTAFSILNSLVQENAPDALRGRIVSIYGLAFRGGMPVGSLVAGFLVNAFGAPPVISSFSLALIGLAAGVYLRNERIRSL